MSNKNRLRKLEQVVRSTGRGVLIVTTSDDKPGVYFSNGQEYTRNEIDEMAADYDDVMIIRIVHEERKTIE